MDMKDVAAISLELSFNKKWWESKRAIAAKGSGTGKALDEWQKNCKKPIDQMSCKEVQAAEDTCALLCKCLKVAISKCKDKQKETLEGCKKYLKLVDKFETDLAARSKQLSNALAGVIVALENYRTKVLAPATQILSKLVGALPQKRKIVELLQTRAVKVKEPQEREVVVKQIATEADILTRLEKQINDASNSTGVSAALKKLAPVIAVARKDPRFRAALVQFQKDQDTFDMLMTKGGDEALNLRNELNLIEPCKTNEAAVHEMQEMVKALQNPVISGLDDLVADWKLNAESLQEAMSDPSAIPPENWDLIDKWEDSLREEAVQLGSAYTAAERSWKNAQAYAKPFLKDEKIVGLLKEAQKLYAPIKKHWDEYCKVTPPILKLIATLQQGRK
jgi:hypothetical protein